jgi:hypothetical protein
MAWVGLKPKPSAEFFIGFISATISRSRLWEGRWHADSWWLVGRIFFTLGEDVVRSTAAYDNRCGE